MRVDPSIQLFVGVLVDSTLRAALGSLTGTARSLFEGGTEQSLRVLNAGEKTYIGRVVEGTLSTDEVDDMRRNVLSILSRGLPDQRLPKECVILACVDDRPLGND